MIQISLNIQERLVEFEIFTIAVTVDLSMMLFMDNKLYLESAILNLLSSMLMTCIGRLMILIHRMIQSQDGEFFVRISV